MSDSQEHPIGFGYHYKLELVQLIDIADTLELVQQLVVQQNLNFRRKHMLLKYKRFQPSHKYVLVLQSHLLEQVVKFHREEFVWKETNVRQ